MKQCSKCGELKPLTDFYKRKGSKDGYRNDCKICRAAYEKQYYLENKNKVAARSKAYREATRGLPTVYLLKHEASGRFYIGSTIKGLPRRFANHWSDRNTLDYPLYQFMRTTNKEDWAIHAIQTHEDRKAIRLIEGALIKSYYTLGSDLMLNTLQIDLN